MNVQVAKLSLLNGVRRTTYPEMGEVSAKRGTLYVLVEVSAPSEEWDAVSRQLVDGAIEAFVISKGPDTASLKEAAMAVNSILLDANANRTRSDFIWAGINIVFMREGEMYLMQAGPALTYIGRGTSVTRFPKSIDSSLFSPLGDQDDVEPRLAKFALQSDDVVAMTGSYLPQTVSEDKLNQVMQGETATSIAEALSRVDHGGDFSSLVVQYEPLIAVTTQPAPAPKVTQTTIKKPTLPVNPAPESNKPTMPATTTPKPTPLVASTPEPTKPKPTPPVASTPEPTKPKPTLPVTPTPNPIKSVFSKPPVIPQVAKEETDQEFAPPLAPKIEPTPAPRPTPTFGSQKPTAPMTPTDDAEQAGTFRSIPAVGSSTPTSRLAPEPTEEESKPQRASTRRKKPDVILKPEPEVISGVARTLGEEEPPPPRPTPRKKAESARPMPASPTPTLSAPVLAGTGPAAPSAPPILRQLGAMLLAVLGATIGGIATAVGWVRENVAPRVASSGGGLDRVSDGFWGMMHELNVATRRLLNQMLPGNRPDPTLTRNAAPPRGDGSDFMKTLVILIPVALILLAATVWYFSDDSEAPTTASQNDGAADYESLMTDAQALITQAGNVDPTTAQDLIARALPLLDQAAPLATTTDEAAAVTTLRTQAQGLLSQAGAGATGASTSGSTVSVVPNAIVTFATPLTATELVFGANALFLIDETRGTVYRLLPDQPAATALEALRPLLTAQERLAAGVTVGTPHLLTWVPAGGPRTGDGLLMLTQEGQMFDYDAGSSVLRQVAFAPVTAQMVATEGYGGNLYFLDATNKQVWKYVPNGTGEYPDAPGAWLTAKGQEQFGNPIDIAIDGYIFLLDANGEIRRYQVGEQKSGFTLDPITPALTAPVAMAKVPPEQTDMFVADAQRVVRFDQNGRFLVEYRSAAGSDWGQIRDLAINPSGDLLYILSDKGVYWVDIQNTRQTPQ